MKLYPFCQPYVWENVKVLLETGFTVKKHKDGKCASEYVNTIILVFLTGFFIGLIGQVVSRRPFVMPIMLGIAALYSVPLMWELITMNREREGFADAKATAKADASIEKPFNPTEVYDVIGAGAAPATVPNAKNPFMNVLVDEIKYHPTRPAAMSVLDPSVKVGLDDFFRTEFYSDPTDVFGRSQSQREFITMPSTSIPNDQGSYQDWLYKIPGKTCKEGGRESCFPGTDGGALPWLNVNPA
jgi:hypothetical protein